MNNEKLKLLSNTIKNARKFSLIGEYGNSLEKYQEAISLIKEREEELINESEDLKEKWKMTEYNIKSEMLQIKDILETCLQLHHSHFNYKKKQLEGNEYINENKKKLEKEIMDIYTKDKRIYDKASNNSNQNKNVNKNKVNKINTNNNIMFNTKKNKTPKTNPWLNNNNKYSFTYNNKYNKLNNSNNSYNTDSNINIKKCKSLKVNDMEKKMFNPLEEFYGVKNENIISTNNNNNINNNNSNRKELKKNGKDFASVYRRSEVIQQKLNLPKILSSSINPNLKSNNNTKKVSNKISSNIIDNNSSKKCVKVVEIDLNEKVDKKSRSNNNIAGIKLDDIKKEGNLDMVEQALNNLSQLKDNNDDDSF